VDKNGLKDSLPRIARKEGKLKKIARGLNGLGWFERIGFLGKRWFAANSAKSGKLKKIARRFNGLGWVERIGFLGKR